MRPRKKDRHLPQCVYERHGSFWLVKGGKWTNLGKTLPEAMAAYGRKLGQPTGEMADLVDKAYDHWSKQKKRADSSQKLYKMIGEHIKGQLIEFTPSQVAPRNIAELKLSMHDRPGMWNLTLAFLKQMFDYALDMELIDSNPAARAKFYEMKGRAKYMTDAEFTAIREQADAQLRCIMDLCYLTAQRPIDIINLKRSAITENGIEFVQQKTGAKLVVRMSEALKAAVDAAKALDSVAGLMVFRGARYKTINPHWNRACERAGVEGCQLRDIRSKSITDASRQGLNPQILAGHRTASMTNHYIKIRDVPIADGPSFGQAPKLDKSA